MLCVWVSAPRNPPLVLQVLQSPDLQDLKLAQILRRRLRRYHCRVSVSCYSLLRLVKNVQLKLETDLVQTGQPVSSLFENALEQKTLVLCRTLRRVALVAAKVQPSSDRVICPLRSWSLATNLLFL